MTRGGARPGAGRPKGTTGGGWGTGAGGRPKGTTKKNARRKVAFVRLTDEQSTWLEGIAEREQCTASAVIVEALEAKGMPHTD